MTGNGRLGGEIQRKTAEIDNWPDWAKPYEPQTPSDPAAGGEPPTPAHSSEDPGSRQAPKEHEH
jgi:hypothetical protein